MMSAFWFMLRIFGLWLCLLLGMLAFHLWGPR